MKNKVHFLNAKSINQAHIDFIRMKQYFDFWEEDIFHEYPVEEARKIRDERVQLLIDYHNDNLEITFGQIPENYNGIIIDEVM